MLRKIAAFFQDISQTVLGFTVWLALGVAVTVALLDSVWLDWAEGRKDVLIEAHGLLFDILFFGLLIAFYSHRKDKEEEKSRERERRASLIQRYQEEIDDFRYWSEREAAFRIVGNIRRLNKLGVTSINLSNCSLRGMLLEGLRLAGARMEYIDLSHARILEVDLRGADLQGANLSHCFIADVDLNQADLRYATLEASMVAHASMQGADLRDVIIKKTSLRKPLTFTSGHRYRGPHAEDRAIKSGHIVEDGWNGADLAGARFYEYQRADVVNTGVKIEDLIFEPDPSEDSKPPWDVIGEVKSESGIRFVRDDDSTPAQSRDEGQPRKGGQRSKRRKR
jgi:uncharacterized protein YjbI with pentapeptide repeats